MEYNDEQVASAEAFSKMARQYQQKLHYITKRENNIHYSDSIPDVDLHSQLDNIMTLLYKSYGYLHYIATFVPKSRYNDKIDINSIHQAMDKNIEAREKITSLFPTYKAKIARTLFVPDCKNYHHCMCQYSWCQLELLKALLLLKLIKNLDISTLSIEKISLQQLDIMQIPIKLIT